MMGSTMAPPDREITISVDEALAAQDAGMAGLLAGSLALTESQFSSFLTILLQQNTGPNFPVESVMAWFEPNNQIFLRATLREGVLLGGDTLDLVGSIMVENQHVAVDLQEATANGMSISGPMLDMVDAQINGALADPSMGVILDVSTDSGTLNLGMGGGM
jgi:hypothetical protein